MDSHEENVDFLRGCFSFATEARIIASEVSFHSSEVLFHSSEVLFRVSVGDVLSPRGDLEISTWRSGAFRD